VQFTSVVISNRFFKVSHSLQLWTRMPHFTCATLDESYIRLYS